MCPKCREYTCNGCKEDVPITEGKKIADHAPKLLYKRRLLKSPQSSSFNKVSNRSAPKLVYKRRKLSGNSATISVEQMPASTKKSALKLVYKRRLLKSPQSSSFSTASESYAPKFVYNRRKLSGNPACIFSVQIPASIRKSSPKLVYKRRLLKSSQSSSFSTVSESSVLKLVYNRRKLSGNSAANSSVQIPTSARKSAEHCPSVISSDALHGSATVGIPILPSIACDEENHVSKSSANRFLLADFASSEAFKNSKLKIIEVDSMNDSCSSSKSNLDLDSAFVKNDVDDNGECSSSSVVEFMGEDLSEKDICISILRSHGLLDADGVHFSRGHTSVNDVHDSGSIINSQSCKICLHTGSTLKMLICDNCEAAFHVSCCNPRSKRIPIDEWFCQSCLKKKHKIIKDIAYGKATNIIGEMERQRIISCAGEPNPIILMLRDSKPYTSDVRVGKGFQAEVPEWSGPDPIKKSVDNVGEPLELDSSEIFRFLGLKSKPSKVATIGNWLQCREVIDGADGTTRTICGKWRRAPLFEVQSDDWECFCSVLWDPIHADCAVPQELETDQVLKQLNYIQMLRPRLAAERQKIGRQQDEQFIV